MLEDPEQPEALHTWFYPGDKRARAWLKDSPAMRSWCVTYYGGGFGTMPAFATDYFGAAQIGSIYGLMHTLGVRRGIRSESGGRNSPGHWPLSGRDALARPGNARERGSPAAPAPSARAAVA